MMKKTVFCKRFVLAVAFIALVLASCVAHAAAPSRGDLIRFIPTFITVEPRSVTVEGYFVNLNKDIDVGNFDNFEMSVYLDGELLVEGDFGEINQFMIKPMRTQFQSFTFNGAHDLNEGEYACSDMYYAVVSCDFSYR